MSIFTLLLGTDMNKKVRFLPYFLSTDASAAIRNPKPKTAATTERNIQTGSGEDGYGTPAVATTTKEAGCRKVVAT